MQKLKSRKLWIAIGGVASILIAAYSGVEIDPEALAGLAFIVGTYVFGQALVDKDVVAEQVKVAGDAGKLQLQLYARNLEQELAAVMAPSQIGVGAETVQSGQLVPVPDIEE